MDMSTCGKEGCKSAIMLKDISQYWEAEGAKRTLTRAGRYTKASDTRQLTVMLRKLCFAQQWSSGCTAFCIELAAKTLTAAQALQHPFLQLCLLCMLCIDAFYAKILVFALGAAPRHASLTCDVISINV